MLVDDHPFLRAGLREAIKEKPELNVVCEASSGDEAMENFAEHRPDVIVLDINLGNDESGLDLVSGFRDIKEDVRILVLSMYEDYEYLRKAFVAGINGYVVKGSDADNVVFGISVVASGQTFLGPKMAGCLVRRMLDRESHVSSDEDIARYDELTSREQEIFRLLVSGMTSKQIGKELYISPKTVDNHKSKIMSKLGVHNTVGLFRFAGRIGLLVDESY